MDYTEKYLIYKKKYINLKKLLQSGGMNLQYAAANQFASREILKEINKNQPKFKKNQLCIIDNKRVCRIVTIETVFYKVAYKVEYKDAQGITSNEDKVTENRLIECPKSIADLPNPYIYKILEVGKIVILDNKEQVKIVKIQNDSNKELYEVSHIETKKPNSLSISRNSLQPLN